MSANEKFPSRLNGLQIEAIGDELVVYNPCDDRAHCLTGLAAKILPLCDGSTALSSFEDVPLEDMEDILKLLSSRGLLDTSKEPSSGRRTFLKRALALGTITSLTLPLPAAADSTLCAALMCGMGQMAVVCVCTNGATRSGCVTTMKNCNGFSMACKTACQNLSTMKVMVTVKSFSCCDC